MRDLEDLRAKLRLGAISRRAFLARAAALGASATLLSTIADEARAAAADAPKKGGLFRLGLAGGDAKDSFDPASYLNSVMIVVGRGLFNGLVELTADGKLAPELATSWEARSGAAEWVFNLRRNVKFSDGREFSADDAVYSLNLHRGNSKSAASAIMRGVSEIKKLDKYQLQVSLAAPDADFPFVLTDCRLLMVPADFKDWAKPVGTGAFVLDKFDPGVRIALKKANGDYWKEGRGHFEAAEITVIGDVGERLNALVSNQIDLINRVDPRAVALLVKAPKTEIVRSSGGWHPVFAMETDKAPYDNAELRLAMKYAIDREQILKASFSGYGAIANDHPIPPGDPFFNKDLPQRKRDPDKAAFHLKKSGVDAPLALQTSEAAFPGALDMSALVQISVGKAGLKIELKKEPNDGYWENVWLKSGFAASHWAGRPAATHMLAVAFGATSPLNETHWKNDKFELLLANARSETDEAKRKTYVWEMQALVSEDGGAVIPAFKDWIDAHHTTIGGHTPHSGLDLDNGYILEKAFLKA